MDVLDGVVQRVGELGVRVALAAALLGALVLLGRLVRPLVRALLRRRGRPSYTRVSPELHPGLRRAVRRRCGHPSRSSLR